MEGEINRDLLKQIWSITKEKGGIADPSKENVGFVNIYNMRIEGFSDKEISGHVKYLKDEGFIEAINFPVFEGDKWHPEKILKDLIESN